MDVNRFIKERECSTSMKQQRMTVKDILGDENGFDALQASDDGFNQKLILIKKQLEQRDHPVNELVRQFDRIFFQGYSKEM